MPFKALLLENEPTFSASVQSGLRAVVACGVRAARRAGVLSVPAGGAHCHDVERRRFRRRRRHALMLPHPEVLEYFRRKAQDYDRWLGGMQKVDVRQFDSTPPGGGPQP